MTTFLLLIIFLSFISLGLPDASLGAAWPVMYGDLGVSIAAAGVISFTVTAGTILSSLASGHLLKKYGTGRVNFASTLLTALALMGFAWSPSFVWILLFAIPLGLGAGSVDAGLNSYVALHYKAHHMNWLHSFWGLGATLGPVIMAQVLAQTGNWRTGYWAVGGAQLLMALILALTLPLWSRVERHRQQQSSQAQPADAVQDRAADQILADRVGDLAEGVAEFVAHNQPDEPTIPATASRPSVLRTPGLMLALLTFFLYCGAEISMGLWGSSFLVKNLGLSVETAGRWVSLYFAGIMTGRLLTGFLTLKWPTRLLIRNGILASLVGGLLMLASHFYAGLALPGFILIGLGFAPVFPGMIHETPQRFGGSWSQIVIGYQMAAAYVGSTLFPPTIGWLADRFTLGFLPALILGSIGSLLLITERLNQFTVAKEPCP